jgi:D-xylose 1-dehydrogenase
MNSFETAHHGFATYPSLKDRLVIITGGATGIGAAMVEAFSAQKARVVFIDIQDSAAEQVVRQLDVDDHVVPVYCHCDLTDVSSLQRSTFEIVDTYGSVDVLINNAADDTRHSVADVTPEFWDQSMAINLKHQFFMSQAVIPGMQKAGRGSIINLSSIGWMIPSTNLPVYVAAKAAVVGMTRTLSHEFGPDNIRVNCIMPGAVATKRQKQLWFTESYAAEILASQALKRMIEPEDVARLSLFLASDDSSAITNQTFVIDAGWI